MASLFWIIITKKTIFGKMKNRGGKIFHSQFMKKLRRRSSGKRSHRECGSNWGGRQAMGAKANDLLCRGMHTG